MAQRTLWKGGFLAWLGLSMLLACQSSEGQITFQQPPPPVWQMPAYLIKDSSLHDQVRITADGISLYPPQTDTLPPAPEFQLFPEEYRSFLRLMKTLPRERVQALYVQKGTDRWSAATYDSLFLPEPSPFQYGRDSLYPLKGLRIAIDPGHVALTPEEAELEAKYVKMWPSPQTHMQAIRFNEANLTLATAYLIKEELESRGAEVLLSREEAGKGAQGLSYEAWKQQEMEHTLQTEVAAGRMDEEDARWWRTRAKAEDLYRRLFTPWDLQARAEKINAFHPHLTLIIHYNIDSDNWERRDRNGYFPPTDANYAMAFVPGSFLHRELERVEDRVDFLRLLLSDDIPQSIRLTTYFIRASTRLTGVPIVPRDHSLSYLEHASLPTPALGVYARNLRLTRLVRGPLCYGESLCQDNVTEARALNQRDMVVAGLPTSSRIVDVARAYVRAVLRFARDQAEGEPLRTTD